ncbi:MAG: class I SAM-dependent methyltransferase [Elusimicrobia bacterium]|nr:class I SAM-dependent methyltransferase [Elusimicrobiota bacterium]
MNPGTPQYKSGGGDLRIHAEPTPFLDLVERVRRNPLGEVRCPWLLEWDGQALHVKLDPSPSSSLPEDQWFSLGTVLEEMETLSAGAGFQLEVVVNDSIPGGRVKPLPSVPRVHLLSSALGATGWVRSQRSGLFTPATRRAMRLVVEEPGVDFFLMEDRREMEQMGQILSLLGSPALGDRWESTLAVGFFLTDTGSPASLLRAGRAFARFHMTAELRGFKVEVFPEIVQLARRRWAEKNGASHPVESRSIEKGAAELAHWVPDVDQKFTAVVFRLGKGGATFPVEVSSPAPSVPRAPLPVGKNTPDQDIAMGMGEIFQPVKFPRLQLMTSFLREIRAKNHFPREPEPDLIMDGEAEVAAYRNAGRVDGIMSANYIYQTARITQAIYGCGTVVDLGCGPATQLAQVAAFNPQTKFIGVELSDEMAREARAHVAQLGLSNVTFIKQDMTNLDAFSDHSVDGVMSTLALHHLPTRGHLQKTFQEVNRILAPGGSVYLTDFGRLKSLWTVLFFAYKNADRQPNLFSRDYERSLRAAFLLEDYQALTRECLPTGVRVQSTFRVPFLVAVKTPDKPVPSEVSEGLRLLAKALPSRYKADLNEMRLFYRLGGFGRDLFR